VLSFSLFLFHSKEFGPAPVVGEKWSDEIEEPEEDDEEDEDKQPDPEDEKSTSTSTKDEKKEAPKKSGFFSSLFKTLTGKKILEKEDLAPVIEKFKEKYVILFVPQPLQPTHPCFSFSFLPIPV
jgi:hypothetical protein